MTNQKTKKPKKARRVGKRLSHTLYCYSQPLNGEYARTFGKANFGSFSNYVDALIGLDRKEGFSAKLIKKKPSPQARAA
jgi:hypothetical protein